MEITGGEPKNGQAEDAAPQYFRKWGDFRLNDNQSFEKRHRFARK